MFAASRKTHEPIKHVGRVSCLVPPWVGLCEQIRVFPQIASRRFGVAFRNIHNHTAEISALPLPQVAGHPTWRCGPPGSSTWPGTMLGCMCSSYHVVSSQPYTMVHGSALCPSFRHVWLRQTASLSLLGRGRQQRLPPGVSQLRVTGLSRFIMNRHPRRVGSLPCPILQPWLSTSSF